MTPLIILLAMLLERLLAGLGNWGYSRIFPFYVRNVLRITAFIKFAWLRLFIGLLPPVALTAYAALAISQPSIEQFVFFVVLLTFCLGPRDLGQQVQDYLEAERDGDPKAIEKVTLELTGRRIDAGPGRVRLLTESVFVRAGERVLAVVFWFVVAGPVAPAGALLFRLACQFAGTPNTPANFQHAARRFRGWLGWAPAQITAFAYMLSGSFEHGWQAWRAHYKKRKQGHLDDSNHQLLGNVGIGALQVEHEIQAQSLETTCVEEAAELVRRADFVTLAMVALASLTGIIF